MFGYRLVGQVGGDDIEGEKKVGAGVGDRPATVRDLGAREKAKESLGGLANGIGQGRHEGQLMG